MFIISLAKWDLVYQCLPREVKIMPEICRFLGIVIKMFYDDHNPPHFHAVYGDYEAIFSIETLQMTKGNMPARVQGLIIEWASLHREELKENWRLVTEEQTFKKIQPLV